MENNHLHYNTTVVECGMSNPTDTPSVASTILQQLGGGKFKVMTGANRFYSTGNGLVFRIPYPKVNAIRITLNALDLYDLEFSRVRGTKITLVKSISGVYAEDLQSVFTSVTGLNTHL